MERPRAFETRFIRRGIAGLTDPDERKAVQTSLDAIERGRLSHAVLSDETDGPITRWHLLTMCLMDGDIIATCVMRDLAPCWLPEMSCLEAAIRIPFPAKAFRREDAQALDVLDVTVAAVLAIGETEDSAERVEFWHPPGLDLATAAGYLKQYAVREFGTPDAAN